MLRHRLVTGALLIAGLAALVWCDSYAESRGAPAGVVLGAFVGLIVAPLLAIELARMLRAAGSAVPTILAMIGAWGGVIATAGIPGVPQPATDTATVALVLFCAVAFVAAASRREAAGAQGIVGGALLAFVLAGVLVGYWIKVRTDFSALLFVGCILVVKSSDIGAYFGGRLLGRHKLIPWLSPGKTWEGFVAGIVTSAITAAIMALVWSDRPWVPSPAAAALGGAALGLVGAFGDLAESLLKREARVKDSGRLLPGMGGVFDVVDSLLFAGPLAWVLLRAQ